jgi:NO-binding membrane sensor protein with MHYT domain
VNDLGSEGAFGKAIHNDCDVSAGLVLLSIGVAILGSLTALALTSFSDDSDDSDAGAGQRSVVLTCGGLIMGATIWSMHFVAMMAVDFPVIVTYNLIETVGSIGIAIIATGAGLYLASTRRLGRASIPLGGVLMGLGIAGMHYLGMSAIRGCGLDYDATSWWRPRSDLRLGPRWPRSGSHSISGRSL